MTPEEINELAALHAAGALQGPDLESFEQLLRAGDAQALELLAAHQATTASIALARCPNAIPPAELKTRILSQLPRPHPAPAQGPPANWTGFRHIPRNETSGWQQARIPGASIKVLFADRAAGYAVVLGKLAPGVRYPPHDHVGPEELFILSGDLNVGEYLLRAGDFHHSAAGTHHEENFSVEGCTLLAVVHPSVLDELGVTADAAS